LTNNKQALWFNNILHYIKRVNNLLRKAREDHKNAVQERIETVGQLGDIVDTTKALFAMSNVFY